MKKYLSTVAIILLLAISVGLLAACNSEPWQQPGALTEGDWIYDVVERDINGKKVIGARIIGPTMAARNKEILIVPAKIGKMAVIEVGATYYELEYYRTCVTFNTVRTKKIYVPWEVAFEEHENEEGRTIIDVNVFDTSNESVPKIIFVSTYKFFSKNHGLPPRESKVQYYFSSISLEEDKDDSLRLPNMIYFYNYKGAPNNGVYWADDNELDEKILFPSNPVRDGYEFDGWYTEPQCINKYLEIKKGKSSIHIYANWK